MAKKKRTQLKPIVRGFATTSQPKKVVPVVEVPEETSQVEQQGIHDPEPDAQKLGSQTPGQPLVDEFDPEKVEEQSLQNLVDKLQDKTEKEITRTIKVYHRFILASMPLDCRFTSS